MLNNAKTTSFSLLLELLLSYLHHKEQTTKSKRIKIAVPVCAETLISKLLRLKYTAIF